LLPYKPPILALTASATLKVRQDVCTKLGLDLPNKNVDNAEEDESEEPNWIRTNLKLCVEKAPTSDEARISKVLDLVKRDGSAIVLVFFWSISCSCKGKKMALVAHTFADL